MYSISSYKSVSLEILKNVLVCLDSYFIYT